MLIHLSDHFLRYFRFLQKLLYLTIQNLQTKWETTTHNWKSVLNELSLIVEDRIKPHRFD